MTNTEEKLPPGRQAAVQWASDIRAEKQVWLWEDRIPAGTVSALAGRGGTGKTTYALHLAAQLSKGMLPGQHYGNPRPTLIWSGEDAWGPVLVPRLIAAGADMTRIGRLSITSSVDNGEVTPLLPVDVAPFRDAITDSGAALVIIDPVASTMTGDLHREADVRAAVDALARLAADTGAVVMFVRHFGKGGGNASDKMSGSHAFRDAVRSVFLFAEDDGRVVVTQDKGNYAPPGAESFAFRLENTLVSTDTGDVGVARVVELGASEESVGDIINRAATHDDDDSGERTAAEHWLEDYLTANGATPSKVVKAAAAKEKITEATLKRAKKKIGIVDRSSGFPRTSTWYLPSQLNTDQPTPSREPTEPTEPTGHDQQKPDEPTEPQSQSAQLAQPSTSEPTGEPTGATRTPTPLTVRRQDLRNRRKIRFQGKEFPRCLVCSKPVLANQGDTHISCNSKQQGAAS